MQFFFYLITSVEGVESKKKVLLRKKYGIVLTNHFLGMKFLYKKLTQFQKLENYKLAYYPLCLLC